MWKSTTALLLAAKLTPFVGPGAAPVAAAAVIFLSVQGLVRVSVCMTQRACRERMLDLFGDAVEHTELGMLRTVGGALADIIPGDGVPFLPGI